MSKANKVIYRLILAILVFVLLTMIMVRSQHTREMARQAEVVNNSKPVIAAVFIPGPGPSYEDDSIGAVTATAYPTDADINRWLEASSAELKEMEDTYFSIPEEERGKNPPETVTIPEIPVEEAIPEHPLEGQMFLTSVVQFDEIVEEKVKPTKATISSDPDTALSEVINWAMNPDGSLDYGKFSDMGIRHITGYDCCEACCGKPVTDKWYGYTASGRYVKEGRTCALNGYAFGTVVYIEGLGFRVVEDRGGMQNGGIDVYCDTHASCYAITGNYQVYLVWTPEG